jgi:hypothetical protein
MLLDCYQNVAIATDQLSVLFPRATARTDGGLYIRRKLPPLLFNSEVRRCCAIVSRRDLTWSLPGGAEAYLYIPELRRPIGKCARTLYLAVAQACE